PYDLRGVGPERRLVSACGYSSWPVCGRRLRTSTAPVASPCRRRWSPSPDRKTGSWPGRGGSRSTQDSVSQSENGSELTQLDDMFGSIQHPLVGVQPGGIRVLRQSFGSQIIHQFLGEAGQLVD